MKIALFFTQFPPRAEMLHVCNCREARQKNSKKQLALSVRVLRKVAECLSYKHRCNANDKCSNVFSLLTLMEVAFNNNISQRYFECTSVRSLRNVLTCNIPGS